MLLIVTIGAYSNALRDSLIVTADSTDADDSTSDSTAAAVQLSSYQPPNLHQHQPQPSPPPQQQQKQIPMYHNTFAQSYQHMINHDVDSDDYDVVVEVANPLSARNQHNHEHLSHHHLYQEEESYSEHLFSLQMLSSVYKSHIEIENIGMIMTLNRTESRLMIYYDMMMIKMIYNSF